MTRRSPDLRRRAIVAIASPDADAVAEPGVTTTTAPTAAEQAGLR